MSNLAEIKFSEKPFEQIKHIINGVEIWFARELMPRLGYVKWQKFSGLINRAIAACENTGQAHSEHFLPEPVKSTGGRPGEDYKLTRYACYLVAMNGDPTKPEIAQAQTYFAVKTHQAETMERRLTKMNGVSQLAALIGGLSEALVEEFDLTQQQIIRSEREVKETVIRSIGQNQAELRQLTHNLSEQQKETEQAIQMELFELKQQVETVKEVATPKPKQPRSESSDRNISFHPSSKKEYDALVEIARRSGKKRSQFFLQIIREALAEELKEFMND